MDKDSNEHGILSVLAARGELTAAVLEYLAECKSVPEEHTAAAKGKSASAQRFPNFAGFCRHMEAGVSELKTLRREHPEEYDKLLAIFEDEALNSALSPTLLSAYMKKRLLYAEEEEKAGRQVVWCFEHDIIADGE